MISRGSSYSKSFLQILFLALILAFTAGSAWAADDAEAEDEAATEQAEEEEEADLDKVVVTGSRLQRETYTSISPLQIITAEGSREAGLIDAAEILQKSTAAGGQQIDLSFNGFVLDNGPGASNVDLRGLGAARTLVLLNGRRLAPAGVEGAPFAPDLNLVPGALVRQYEVLLDGASSIYGSDAVAGVTNILMRKDFDGLELDVFWNEPDHDNGTSVSTSVVYGLNFDRGFFGIGAEYRDDDEIRQIDRPWVGRCSQDPEIDENGQIRTQELFYTVEYNMDWDECQLGPLAARVAVPFAGSIYYTPGFTNGGWPNFSESSFGLAGLGAPTNWGVDGDGDGVTDINFQDYDLNGKPAWYNSTLWPENDRLSVMGYGEYIFESEANHTLFFEANYNQRDFRANAGEPQLFPVVPARNPFNICNPDAPGGVDCGLANDALYTNPNFEEQWRTEPTVAALCAALEVPPEFCVPSTFGFLSGPIGPAATQPIVSVRGDRNLVNTDVEQYRGVLGLKGDLLFVDWGSMNNWVYEVGLSYTNSDGTSSRPGIRNDRLQLSLGAYSSTNTPCENDLGVTLASDAAAGCVPVNMFASSLYPVGTVVGDFATAAERDYLFDTRDFDTEYEQTIFTAYANGFLFDLPGGTALGGIGVEWREDEIKSVPDAVARDGLFFGFFSDGGATGSKDTQEVFGEIELPILAGVVGAEELTFNGSVRYTDDEFYGSDTTYSLKLGWRPVSSLLLRGTFGTSFRAPNVRETFLEDQTGFLNVFDPCFIPQSAWDTINMQYIPENDPRDPVVLENCARNGADPTMLYNNGFNTYSTEISRGGSVGLEPETSDSYTYGFAFEQPWWEGFDLTFGVTYYDIDIDDTIIEPTPQFVVNDCYNDPQFDSTFCNNITRDNDGFFDIVDAKFLNRDNERNRGIDINLNYDQDFNVGAQPVRLAVDLAVNHNKEASVTFVDDNGNTNFQDRHGDIYYPEWKGQMGVRVDINDWRVTWVVNYIGDTQQIEDFVDVFSNIYGSAQTCLGPAFGDVNCRDYADTDDYWLNSASIYYYGDTFTAGFGVRNVFDEEPPFVNGTEYTAVNNVPLGAGFDIFGRVYFLNVVWRPDFD